MKRLFLLSCDPPIKRKNIYDSSDELLYIFNEFFVNRCDTFAVQTPEGPYSRVERALTTQDLMDHFQGKATVGLYQLDEQNMVKWLASDIDPEHVEDPKETTKRLLRACLDKNRFYKPAVWLEASRYPDPSYHIWVLFTPKLPAEAARWLGERILHFAGLDPRTVELFPKQTWLTKDRPFGNLVKAPLGLHQRAGKWSCFLSHETFEPLPNEALREAWGCSFNERDLAKINNLADKQRGVQTKITYLPTRFKALENEEEQRIVKLLAKYWREGYRNQLEMAFLGWCLKKGVSYESAYRIVDTITTATNDEEKRARLDLVKYHYQTRRGMASELKGSTGIKEVIREVIKR